jgi:hypothetical protein
VAGKREELFKIGEVAGRSGFTRQQLHNFLTMGLIREDSRTGSGHRLFGPGVFKRLSMIRGLLEKYSLAEIRRTWKAFLRVVLVCLLLELGLGAAVRPPAAAGEMPVRLAEADVKAVRKLFDDLCLLMTEENAGMAANILAASTSQQRLHQIVEQLEAEFESRRYTRFRCDFDPKHDIEVLGPKRATVRVLIFFTYQENSRGAVPENSDPGGQDWPFEVVKGPEGWRIADGKFFDTLHSTQSKIFEDIFLWAAIILIVGCFWGWMFLDCCFRTWAGIKLPWVLAVGLLPGVGALVYFFAVWMRQGPED